MGGCVRNGPGPVRWGVFTGSHSAVVENYRSIVLFTDTVLKLQGKTTKLTVTGKNFSIEYYDKEQLKLTGQIRSAEFESI